MGSRIRGLIPSVVSVSRGQTIMGVFQVSQTQRASSPSRWRAHLRGFVAVLGILSMVAGLTALRASAQTVDDLRGDIPTADYLRGELDDIARSRAALLAELTSAEASLDRLLAQRDSLNDEQRRLAAQIEAATENLRDVAVETYITGGVTNIEFLASVTQASDFSWRHHLIRGHAGSATTSMARLRDLEALADDDVRETIGMAEALRNRIISAKLELGALDPRESHAEALLPLAEAWDRAAIAIERGAWGIAPADKWEKLRFCESTHNYEAISPSGVYRGAYQFDIPTWKTVGGTGDPAQAPPEEQDARARELYARRGDQPWPVCGRHLK